jgi:hypothetical protein
LGNFSTARRRRKEREKKRKQREKREKKEANYVSMALCMGDNRVGDTSGQLAMPQEMGLARRGFTSGTSSPS